MDAMASYIRPSLQAEEKQYVSSGAVNAGGWSLANLSGALSARLHPAPICTVTLFGSLSRWQ